MSACAALRVTAGPTTHHHRHLSQGEGVGEVPMGALVVLGRASV
jgi:hypothetical protein